MIAIEVSNVEDLAQKLEKFEPWDAKDDASLKASCVYAAEKVWPQVALVDDQTKAAAAMREAKFQRTDWLVKHDAHTHIAPDYKKRA